MNKKYLICLDCIYIMIFIITAILMLSVSLNLNNINKKIDELIKLNTPEAIRILPENYIL